MSELAGDIEAVVLATPGVLALYRSGSAVKNLIGAAAERWGTSEDAASRVVIVQSEDRTEAVIAIGIESGAAAVGVAQAVREQVQAMLVARNEPAPFVRLTVMHVADGSALA